MTPFTSILAATDFSIDGDNAVRRAALLAHEHGARLTIVHVLRPAGRIPLRNWLSTSTAIGLRLAHARQSLRSLALEIAGRHDVSARVEVMIGQPVETLLQASEHADMLVLGGRSHGRFAALPVGGTVGRLLGMSRQPLLVVRTSVEGTYRRVLVPVDFRAPSDAAVLLAARLVPDSGIHSFHAINSCREAVLRDADVPEPVIRQSRLRQEAGAIARMRRMAASLGLERGRVSFSVGHGHPVSSTLFHARRLGADLIVAGKEDRTTLSEILLGSVSRRILAGSACDMLIVVHGRSDSLADTPPPRHRRSVSASRADTAGLARSAAALAGASMPEPCSGAIERCASTRLGR